MNCGSQASTTLWIQGSFQWAKNIVKFILYFQNSGTDCLFFSSPHCELELPPLLATSRTDLGHLRWILNAAVDETGECRRVAGVLFPPSAPSVRPPSLTFPTDSGVADILCHKIICVVPVSAAHVSHCWETNTAPPDAGLFTSCCGLRIKNCGDSTT